MYKRQQLSRYQFRVTKIHANRMNNEGMHLWQYSDEAIDRLKSPKLKALFVTNPSNPPSYTCLLYTSAENIDVVPCFLVILTRRIVVDAYPVSYTHLRIPVQQCSAKNIHAAKILHFQPNKA